MQLRSYYPSSPLFSLALLAAAGPVACSGGGMSTSTTSDATSATTGSTSDATETGSTSATSGAGLCGDGVIDAGEECDDGNSIDADECTNACTLAGCGDGIVGPGEACDDGNDVDDDGCSNACAAALCGDGIVQAGEACDDGNAIDTDACRADCQLAICGDAVVQEGVEECDDGNVADGDGCTSACALPTCDDGLPGAGESDVDCGGDSCPKCPAEAKCGGAGDCASAYCPMGTCAIAPSCQAIKLADPGAPSGIYTVDVDGDGAAPPVNVYCDQTTDEGGWMMVFKVSSGVMGDALDLWQGMALNDQDDALLGVEIADKHYVSGFIGASWNVGGVAVTDVRVHVYTGGEIQKFWRYDGAMSDSMEWYSNDRLTDSSYEDLPAVITNRYSIIGENTSGRRFFINKAYNGCPGDTGWLSVDTTPDNCLWDKNNDAAPIRIMYAPGTKVVNWTDEVVAKTIGSAEVFAVFVR